MSLRIPNEGKGVLGLHSPYVPAINCICGSSPEYTNNWMGYELRCVNRNCPVKLRTGWRDTSWKIGQRWNDLVRSKQ